MYLLQCNLYACLFSLLKKRTLFSLGSIWCLWAEVSPARKAWCTSDRTCLRSTYSCSSPSSSLRFFSWCQSACSDGKSNNITLVEESSSIVKCSWNRWEAGLSQPIPFFTKRINRSPVAGASSATPLAARRFVSGTPKSDLSWPLLVRSQLSTAERQSRQWYFSCPLTSAQSFSLCLAQHWLGLRINSRLDLLTITLVMDVKLAPDGQLHSLVSPYVNIRYQSC